MDVRFRHYVLIALVLCNICCGKSIIYNTLIATTSKITGVAKKLFATHKTKKEAISQTEAHFIRFATKKLNNFRADFGGHNVLSGFENKKTLCDVAHRIIDIEKQEAERGNYTFVHGQPWILQFYQDLYTHIFKTVMQVPCQNFFFLRFKQLFVNNIAAFQEKLDRHQLICSHYLTNGTPGYYAYCSNAKQNRNYLLFLNYALFSNQFGSSSARYIAKGDSENGISSWLNPLKIFKCFGLDHYYSAFAEQLKDLKHKHKKLAKHGHAVVISCTPAALKKCTYISWTGMKKPFYFNKKNKTHNVKTVLDKLRTDPYALSEITIHSPFSPILSADHNEFCLILSLDGALKPNNGVRIFSIPPVPEKEWKSYCSQRDALFKQISDSINQELHVTTHKAYWQSIKIKWNL